MYYSGRWLLRASSKLSVNCSTLGLLQALHCLQYPRPTPNFLSLTLGLLQTLSLLLAVYPMHAGLLQTNYCLQHPRPPPSHLSLAVPQASSKLSVTCSTIGLNQALYYLQYPKLFVACRSPGLFKALCCLQYTRPPPSSLSLAVHQDSSKLSVAYQDSSKLSVACGQDSSKLSVACG